MAEAMNQKSLGSGINNNMNGNGPTLSIAMRMKMNREA
jgi:hypothetical protein